MVDPLRVHRLLRLLTERLALLERASCEGDLARRSVTWLPGVRYLLQSAVEACSDIAQHLCASEGWGPPDDNAEAMRLLGRHGVLDDDHAQAMARAIGFRNVLVHDYAVVDDDIVLERLADHADLVLFARQVARWVDRA